MRVAILSALIAFSSATTAPAAIITATLEGEFESGVNTANLFSAGSNLAGVAFKAVVVFDDATPGVEIVQLPEHQIIYGLGPQGDPPGNNSPGTAMITINRISRSIAGDWGSGFGKSDHDELGSQLAHVYAEDLYLSLDERFHSYDGIILYAFPFVPIDYELRKPFILSHEDANFYGEISFTSYDRYEGVYASWFSGQIGRFTTLTVTVGPSPVPEPLTWAMMIAGFGLVGNAMRRRKALAGAV